MFTGFASENTPGVKVWDYTRTTDGTIRVALEDDCAPFQLFLTGGSSNTIILQLPTGSPSGKQITIKNEPFSTFNIPVIEIYDSVSGSNGSGARYVLGMAQKLTFVCVPNLTIRSGSSISFVQWVPLEQGGLETLTQNSSVLSGESNRVQGSFSVITGGLNNTAAASYSYVGGGSGNYSGAQYSSTVGGQNNTAAGDSSTAVGGASNSANNQNSAVIAGNNNLASASNSICLAGSYGTTRAIVGNTVLPACTAPITTTRGVSQSGLSVLARQTTDATATRLTSNTSAATTTNQVILPNNSAYYFRGEVIAGVTGAGDTKGWYVEGVIKRGANAASTVLVGTPTVTSSYADAGASAWTITATADTTNGGLAITVTGAAATTIRWVAQIRTTEMTF
jgi:hypothetical protein